MKNKFFTVLLLTWVVASLMAQSNFEKALSHYKQGQYSKAIEEFEQIVKANPDYESGHRILGDSYLRIKKYEKAIEAFENALRLKSDNYISFYGLALAYYNSGKYGDAIATLLKGERYARSPRDQYQLHHTRGSAYYNINEFDQAISDLQKAISIQRGKLKDALQLGISHYRLGDFTQAEKYLKQALTLDPDASEAKRYLSRLLYRQAISAFEVKNYKEAAVVLKHYVKENAQDADAWFNLGLAQLFSQNLEAAESAFLNSASLAPDNWEVYDRLGYIYEKKKDYNKSLQNYQKAQNLHPAPQIEESLKRMKERMRRK
ncbi:tetratricopeptide repeat protein [Acidobacteria bacterium AH-259-L09]|nr:tetratricopeptide repeat protein [Acidobacteria bacterium AH-259-L09]